MDWAKGLNRVLFESQVSSMTALIFLVSVGPPPDICKADAMFVSIIILSLLIIN